jgi:zinc finger protein CreA/MIG
MRNALFQAGQPAAAVSVLPLAFLDFTLLLLSASFRSSHCSSYRIHLSPGSRRSSTRSAIARAMNNNTQPLSSPTRRPSTSSSSAGSPPLSAPPPLEPARVYTFSTPPDSPPQLTQATLPATAHPPPECISSRSSSTPEAPVSSQPISISSQHQHSHTYSHYRSGTTTYQEQSQGAGFTYVHTTPISHSAPDSSTHSLHHPHDSYSYPSSHHDDDHHPVSHPHHHLGDASNNHDSSSPPPTHVSSISSRHSISHISHPHHRSLPPSYSHSHTPDPSSPSSPSQTHAVPPSSYSLFHEDGNYHRSGLHVDHAADQGSSLSGGHQINSQGQLVHPQYSPAPPLLSAPAASLSSVAPSHGFRGRFDSPPPILAPIQDERAMRGDARLSSSLGLHGHHPHHLHQHSPSIIPPYMHHPQPLATDYSYHQTIGLDHGHLAWKVDGGVRSKGVGALVQ